VIRINHPGDGMWVMRRIEGVFNAQTDHVVAMARDDGSVLGGVVFNHWSGAAIWIHMAGTGGPWATPDFLWVVFDYAFNQLGVRKLIGPVASGNALAIAIDRKLGFRYETHLADMTPDGQDLLFMSMKREDCRWLRWRPKHYGRNSDRREAA
jgi:RimJ/RimL family protein N-acetyltransferase